MFEEGDACLGGGVARGLATLASGLSEAGTEVSGASVVLDGIPHGEGWRATDSGHLPLSPASGGRLNLSLLKGSLGWRKALRAEGAHARGWDVSLVVRSPQGFWGGRAAAKGHSSCPCDAPLLTAAWGQL